MATRARASNELLSAQLDRAIETFRFLSKLMTELWAILISADVLLVVYGLSTASFGPMLIGSGFLLVATIATYTISRSLVPVAYVAFSLERELGLTGSNGLAHVVGAVMLDDLYARFVTIYEDSDGHPPLATRALAPVRARIGSGLTFAFAAAFTIQVAVGITLWLVIGLPLVNGG
jgi:hypothetical protein